MYDTCLTFYCDGYVLSTLNSWYFMSYLVGIISGIIFKSDIDNIGSIQNHQFIMNMVLIPFSILVAVCFIGSIFTGGCRFTFCRKSPVQVEKDKAKQIDKTNADKLKTVNLYRDQIRQITREEFQKIKDKI